MPGQRLRINLEPSLTSLRDGTTNLQHTAGSGVRVSNGLEAKRIESRSQGPRHKIVEVFFRTNRWGEDSLPKEITEPLTVKVNQYSEMLKKVKGLQFEFEGYADHRGDEKYNLNLARRRAQAVSGFFMKSIRSKLDEPALAKERLVSQTRSFGERESPQPSRHGPPIGQDVLQQWRKVAIYVNVSKRTVEDLNKKLQKAARQALERHSKGIRKLREQAEKYRQRLAGGPNAAMYDNLIDFNRYSKRVKWYEERYRALQEAIEKGNEAFLEWRRGYRKTGLQGLKEWQQSRVDLRSKVERQFQERKSKLTEEEKQIFEEVIYLLNASIKEADEQIAQLKADTRF